MIKKKLIKNIAKNGVINGANANYTFTFPLINQDNTISIDLTNYYNKSEVDAEINNIKETNLWRKVGIGGALGYQFKKKLSNDDFNIETDEVFRIFLRKTDLNNNEYLYNANYINQLETNIMNKFGDYYTKTETDNLLSDFDGEIDDLQSQITNINGSLVGQDEFNTLQTQVNTNTTNITINANNLTNTNNKLDRVITELNNATLINYQGEWSTGTTATLGQVYSYNNQMYLCKVENTTNTPTNTNDWDLISSTDVNLSNYYNRSQIDNMLSDINTNITNLQTTLNNDIQELGNELNEVSNNLSNNFYTKEQIDNNLNSIQDKTINTIENHNNAYSYRTCLNLSSYNRSAHFIFFYKVKTNEVSSSKIIKTYDNIYINNLETNLQNQINELKSNGGVSGALNITTDEQIVPNFTIMGKPVYCKYIDENLTTNQEKVILENIELLVWNGVSIFSSRNSEVYNQTGGKARYVNDKYAYAGVYVHDNKIYVSRMNLSENFSFKGIIYYTKI